MLAQTPTTGIILLIFRCLGCTFVDQLSTIPQELDSGAWFKFSDETVVPLTAKSKLGLQEEDGMKKVLFLIF